MSALGTSSVCLWSQGGVCLWSGATTPWAETPKQTLLPPQTLPSRHHTWVDTPPGRHHFTAQCMLGSTVADGNDLKIPLHLQGWGARPYAGLSLLKVKGKFNTNSNGADTAYICKHSVCLHTQKCAHNVVTQLQWQIQDFPEEVVPTPQGGTNI